jgi:ribosome recycling factor
MQIVRTTMELELQDDERELLIRLLEHTLEETRVEVRRTRTPDFHDKLLEEEQMLRGLLKRLQEI